jgi:hypothetical protein
MKRWKLKILGIALIVLVVGNFFLQQIIAESLGGDAVNGKIEGGRYYVGRGHGTYTEVSESVFQYSKIHTYVMIGSIPLAWIGGMLLLRSRKSVEPE